MSCQLTDLEITDLFARLSGLVEDVFSEARDIIGLDVDLSKQGLEDKSSAGFWDDFTSDETFELQANLNANAAFNPSEVNTAGVKFNNILTTLFGGPTVVPDVTTSVDTEFSGKIDNALDSLFANCASGVSAADTIQGIVGIQATKLTNVFGSLKSTFGVIMGNSDEVGGAVFITALKNYIIKSTAQNLLLTQIRDEINNINKDVEDMDAGDYSINHKTVLSASIVELSAADNLLRAQLDNVLRNFPISFGGVEDAREHIKNVKEVLCGIDLSDIFGGFLSLTALKITGRLIYLEELLNILKELDEEVERIYINLGSFDTAFEDVIFFDSLMIPIIQLLRCRLNVVMADMQQAMDRNKLAVYVLKEKEWCFELAILESLIKASKVFDVDLRNGPLSVDGLDGVLDFLFKDVSDRGDIVSVRSILGSSEAYIKNVRHKLSFNVPVLQIQARGNAVNRLIETRINENEKFGLLINQGTLAVEGNLLSGLTILTKFLGSIRKVDALGSTAKQVEEGNLKGLLNGDFLQDSIKGTYEEVLSQIQTSLKTAGCRLVNVGDKSLAAYDIFEDVTRSEALLNESLAGFPEERLKQSVRGELPKYN